MLLRLEYPPVELLVESPGFYNKIAFIYPLAAVVPALIFFVAGRQKGLVPRGTRTIAEVSVEFVEKQVIMPTMGPEGLRYLPVMMSFFLFVFFGNITEVIPLFHMPGHARMAGPLVIALVVWVYVIAIGVKHNGLHWFKTVLLPPGVPGALLPLVAIIEFLSAFFIRPFSHAVRLFANMLAGHILLVTFGVLCIGLWSTKIFVIVEALTFPGLVIFTAFEIGVSFIQAFVFTILAGVYFGGALHPEH